MDESHRHKLRYSARDLKATVVLDFARAAGYALDGEGISKATRALSRCLSRSLYELTSRGGRDRWSFVHRGQLFQVLVEEETPVQVLRVMAA